MFTHFVTLTVCTLFLFLNEMSLLVTRHEEDNEHHHLYKHLLRILYRIRLQFADSTVNLLEMFAQCLPLRHLFRDGRTPFWRLMHFGDVQRFGAGDAKLDL